MEDCGIAWLMPRPPRVKRRERRICSYAVMRFSGEDLNLLRGAAFDEAQCSEIRGDAGDLGVNDPGGAASGAAVVFGVRAACALGRDHLHGSAATQLRVGGVRAAG